MRLSGNESKNDVIPDTNSKLPPCFITNYLTH